MVSDYRRRQIVAIAPGGQHTIAGSLSGRCFFAFYAFFVRWRLPTIVGGRLSPLRVPGGVLQHTVARSLLFRYYVVVFTLFRSFQKGVPRYYVVTVPE